MLLPAEKRAQAQAGRRTKNGALPLSWARWGFVGEGGLEPPRPEGHWHLKPARLPFRHSPECRWPREATPKIINPQLCLYKSGPHAAQTLIDVTILATLTSDYGVVHARLPGYMQFYNQFDSCKPPDLLARDLLTHYRRLEDVVAGQDGQA